MSSLLKNRPKVVEEKYQFKKILGTLNMNKKEINQFVSEKYTFWSNLMIEI
jgi:hypothetical protein